MYSPNPHGAYLLGEDKLEHIKYDYKIGIQKKSVT